MSSSTLFVLAVILLLSAHPSFALFQTSSGREQDLTEEEGAAVFVALTNLLETFNGFDTSNWFDSGFAYANVHKIKDKRIAIRYARWTELCTIGTWEKARGDLVLKDFRTTVTYLRPYLLQGYSWAAISNAYAWLDYYLLHKDEATLQLPLFNVSNHEFSTADSSNGEYLPPPPSSSVMSSVSRDSPVEKTGFLDCPVWPLVLLSHNSGIWDVLKVGEYLTSANKRIRLTMQRDCNLVLSDKQNSRVLWSSKSAGHGSKCFLRLQSDGNLVIYKGSGKGAVWAINQDCGQGGVKFSFLVIEDDGNLVLYRSKEGKLKLMWATKTKI
ncbi:hypothetical protein SUGI_0572290 [Cryptomeria japonica]|uniref:uncharacterized protein LOC131033587 n=1 Tax=Cryptomeria japonica TaxID=3369 RepID=UPI0024089AC0|nr:uncharacterized protein LOC131033587 [Cryptomeria japonica]GLJ28994.1 hypothetical protein SUGI_0572290 [Cryptomeria japonica]